MPKLTRSELIQRGRDLLKHSKHLCQASRERIERGKRLREDLDERTLWPDVVRRKAAHAE